MTTTTAGPGAAMTEIEQALTRLIRRGVVFSLGIDLEPGWRAEVHATGTLLMTRMGRRLRRESLRRTILSARQRARLPLEAGVIERFSGAIRRHGDRDDAGGRQGHRRT